MTNRRGFTLIELLVVISIIGLLASVVLVSLNGARKKARDAQRKANLKQMQVALELYYSDNGAYPNTSSSWWGETSTYGSHGLTGASGYIPNLAPAYISSLPHDPNTNIPNTTINPSCGTAGYNAYLYYSNGTDYKLLAHCIPESTLPAGDPMLDPYPRTYAYTVYSPGGAGW